MKKLKRRFRLRTVLLTAVTVALIASSAAFAVVSAAENVTPTDATPPDSVVSEEISQSTEEISQIDTAEPPENLENPAVTMTTDTLDEYLWLRIAGTDVYADPGDGNLVACDSVDPDESTIVRIEMKATTVKLYGNIKKLDCEGQGLTSIAVANAPVLERLYVPSNVLTTLDVSGCTALKELVCDYNQLTSLNVSNNTALEVLNCAVNHLTSLNVSNNAALTYLYCDSNELTSLDISHNPALVGLGYGENEIPQIDVSDRPALQVLKCCGMNLTSLDVSSNTALEELYCYNNMLTELNVASNPDLRILEAWGNQLTELDVSHNTALTLLNIGQNQLTELDVSDLANLEYLYIWQNRLMTLDVSHNPHLRDLSCEDNQLTELDVSHNPGLQVLFCSNNRLTSLDLSANTALYILNCYGNNLSFSALGSIDMDAIRGRENDYGDRGSVTYAPQTVVLPSAIAEGESIDLSANYSVNGTLTQFTWYDASGNEVTPATAEGGVFTFGDDVAGKRLVCKMTNAQFTDFREGVEVPWWADTDHRLATTKVKMPGTVSLGEPVAIITTDRQPDEWISLGIEGTDVYIDVDDGAPTEYGDLHYEWDNLTSVELHSQTVKLYGNITYLDVREDDVTALDISGAASLKMLNCSNNALTSLDVSGNTALMYLCCDYNNLTALDVKSNTALEDLSCSFNQIRRIDLSKNTALQSFTCNHDAWDEYAVGLTSLDVSHCPDLVSLECTGNSLTSLDVSHCSALESLRCDANSLTSLNVSNNSLLTNLSCADNKLTSLDLSHNPDLEYLACDVNRLTALDVSLQTSLTSLFCRGNQLTALDVSHNSALNMFGCGENKLTEIDVSQNNRLAILDCTGNYLSLSALGAIDGDAIRSRTTDWGEPGEFNYGPQYIRTPERLKVGQELDLSAYYSYDGTVTEFTWYGDSDAVVTPETAEGGVFTFGEDVEGQVLVCKMTNAKFPDFTVVTEEWPIYDDEGNETGEVERWDNDKRLTTGNIWVTNEDMTFVSVKAGAVLDMNQIITNPADLTGKIQWSTLNRNVATVDANGQLKALADGYTYIKARCGDYYERVFVVVEKAVILNKYELSFTRTTAKPSPIATLTAKKPADVQNVVWYSDNPEVATVTDRGAVKAVGAGVANIYCDDTEGNAESIACVVTVEDFIITGEDENFKGNQAYVLTGETADLALLNANHGAITWKSSNAAVASVDGSGRVTAKKAGTVTITATAADKKASDSIKLTVVAPTESLTVTGVPSFVYVDQMATLKATLTKGSTDKVFWSSADESVATVDANGKIKGIAQGETTVTATTFSGKSQTVPVVVRTKAASVSWTTGHPDMSIAKTVKFGIAAEQQLNLAIKIDAPADCNDTVTWKSSNAKVATVEPSADGQSATVTGVAKGTAVITVRTGSGKTLTATVSVVTVPAEQITLNKNSASLYVGSSLALSAKLAPKGCNDVIIWSSSDPNVASVSENGSVKALSAGTATITAYSATNGEIRDTAEITVRTKAAQIEWVSDNAGSSITKEFRRGMQVSQTLTLDMNIVSPDDCSDTVTWTTSSAKVATVEPSANGRSATVTGVAKGTAVITVKTGSGKKLTARVTVVSVPATAVTLNKKEAALYVGSSVNLTAKTQPKGCNDVIRWSSSDPTVATVNESGSVKALSAGTATVTAYSEINGEIRDTAEITVRTKATQVEWVNDDAGSLIAKEFRRGMQPEQTLTLSVNIVSPANCSDTVTWTTSSAKTATVEPSEDGRSATVTAKASGTAVITAKTGSGKKLTARVTVVTVPAASLTLNKQNVSVYTGASVTLTAKTQSKICNDVIRWSSSDPAVATVNENGSVMGIAQGTATVTAYSSIDGEIMATAEITVRTKAQKLVINATDVNLAIGEEDVLFATLTPEGSNDTVTWSISNPKIASLSFDEYGNTVVRGLAKGSAVVTVETGSGKTATAKVVVVG